MAEEPYSSKIRSHEPDIRLKKTKCSVSISIFAGNMSFSDHACSTYECMEKEVPIPLFQTCAADQRSCYKRKEEIVTHWDDIIITILSKVSTHPPFMVVGASRRHHYSSVIVCSTGQFENE